MRLLDYSYNNKLKNSSTKLKVLFVISNLGLSVFSSSPVVPFIIFATMLFLTIFLAEIPFRDYFRWFSIPLLFAFPLFLLMIFFSGDGTQWASFNLFGYELTASKNGFNLGLLVVSRVLSGTSCLLFLAITTPMTKLSSALKLLKIPDIVIELTMMIYRYIFVVLDEATRMERSQRTRLGYSSFKKSLNSLSLLAANIFIRAMNRGEKVYVSLESRCYSGKIVFDEEISIPKLQLIILFVFEGLLFIVMHLTEDFRIQ